jgi:hypothetical protein
MYIITKTQATKFYLRNSLVNSDTDEIIVSELFYADNNEIAEKNFLKFWDFCLFNFTGKEIKLNKYKVIQQVIDFEGDKYYGFIVTLKDNDKPLNCYLDKMLVIKKDLNLYNLKAYKYICELYDIKVPEIVIEIEKRLPEDYEKIINKEGSI